MLRLFVDEVGVDSCTYVQDKCGYIVLLPILSNVDYIMQGLLAVSESIMWCEHTLNRVTSGTNITTAHMKSCM